MNRNAALPISSRQVTLETTSRNQLAILFDPAIFELRAENQRDKVIDIISEIKQDGVYTNFRFAVTSSKLYYVVLVAVLTKLRNSSLVKKNFYPLPRKILGITRYIILAE